MSKVLVLHYSMYGHTADGSRQPSDTELELARFQGHHVATVSADVIAGRRPLAAEIHSPKVIGSAK